MFTPSETELRTGENLKSSFSSSSVALLLILNDAELPFDWVLSEVTGRSGMVEFVMLETAKCPNCREEISEKTLVER